MKKNTPLPAILAALVLPSLAGCASGLQMNHAADPLLRPASYKTYGIIEHGVGQADADVQIEAAIHEAMKTRGYVHEKPGQVDLLVSVKVLTTLKAESALGTGRLAAGDGFNDDGLMQQRLDKLVLLQLQDARSLKIVWVGWSQAAVTPEQLSVRATEAVSGLLNRVPARI